MEKIRYLEKQEFNVFHKKAVSQVRPKTANLEAQPIFLEETELFMRRQAEKNNTFKR